jgi:hypothetical protein
LDPNRSDSEIEVSGEDAAWFRRHRFEFDRDGNDTISPRRGLKQELLLRKLEVRS